MTVQAILVMIIFSIFVATLAFGMTMGVILGMFAGALVRGGANE